MKDERDAAEPGADDQPDVERGRLPGGEGDQRRRHQNDRPPPDPIHGTAGRGLVSQQQRGLDETHLEQRHDRKQQRYERADAQSLNRRAQRHPVLDVGENWRVGGEKHWNRRDHPARQRDAEQAAGESEREDLQQIDSDDLAASGPHTFQHGDAAEFLQDEDAGHARHRDPAEDDDHQTDHAQVVLGPFEVFTDRIVRRAERARVDELVAELLAQRPHQRIGARFRDADENRAPHLTAESDEAGRVDVGEVDQHARAEAEVTHAPAWLGGDHPADGERPLADGEPVADPGVERRQELRTDERSEVGEERVRVDLATLEPHLAVEGKLGGDRA